MSHNITKFIYSFFLKKHLKSIYMVKLCKNIGDYIMMKVNYKRFFDNQYLPLKELEIRSFVESKNDRNRNNYSRDYARLLYSNSFKRLQGKMQLFSVTPDKFYRNRLTHSMEVAQISRSIGQQLNNYL